MKHMTQLDKNIAFNLKRIRKSKNMSLDMLAERTGVSKSMLGQIERGESNPTVSTIGIHGNAFFRGGTGFPGKGRRVPDLCDAALRCGQEL